MATFYIAHDDVTFCDAKSSSGSISATLFDSLLLVDFERLTGSPPATNSGNPQPFVGFEES